MTAFDWASVIVAACGLVAGLVVLGSVRKLGLALSVAIELWTAAILLQLAADSAWQAIGGAVTVILVREVVVWAMHHRPRLDAAAR